MAFPTRELEPFLLSLSFTMLMLDGIDLIPFTVELICTVGCVNLMCLVGRSSVSCLPAIDYFLFEFAALTVICFWVFLVAVAIVLMACDSFSFLLGSC